MTYGTYGMLHADDIVLGSNGGEWRVVGVQHEPRFAVALRPGAGGAGVTGYPNPGEPVTVLAAADVSAEREAAAALLSGGLGPLQIITEIGE